MNVRKNLHHLTKRKGAINVNLRRKLFAAVSSLAVMAALLAGCGTQETSGTALQETGTLTLSVNPEIRIEYDLSLIHI